MAKIGICEFTEPVNGPTALDYAKDCGYDGVQITDLGGYHKGFPLNNKFVQDGYKEAMARTGLEIPSYHLMTLCHSKGHCMPMNTPEGELAKFSMEKGLQACYEMGIPNIMLSTPYGKQGLDAEAQKNVIEFLKYAVAICSEKGITVALEPDSDMAMFRELMDAVPGLLICDDICSDISDDRGYEIPETMCDLIEHVHIKDVHEVNLEHGHRRDGVIVGTGDFAAGMKECIHILKEKGWDGWYYSESFTVDCDLPEDTGRDENWKEPTINDPIHPTTFGSDDLSEVMKKDCKAIREFVESA